MRRERKTTTRLGWDLRVKIYDVKICVMVYDAKVVIATTASYGVMIYCTELYYIGVVGYNIEIFGKIGFMTIKSVNMDFFRKKILNTKNSTQLWLTRLITHGCSHGED